MFGLDWILLGFFVSLGAKGGIDTYDGAKEIVTDALGSEKVHDVVERVKGTAQTVVNEVERGATAAKIAVADNIDTIKKVVVEGAEKAKTVVTEGVHVIHEKVDNTLNIRKDGHVEGKGDEREPNEDRIGAFGDEAKGAAAA